MKPHPYHVDGRLKDAEEHFDGDADDFHHYFEVLCECGKNTFRLFESNKSSVKALCVACGHEVTVYDLSQYPAASKPPGAESFVPMNFEGNETGVRVFVMYEYGELDEDQAFDPNDISWCQIFVENDKGQMVKVFDDETA